MYKAHFYCLNKERFSFETENVIGSTIKGVFFIKYGVDMSCPICKNYVPHTCNACTHTHTHYNIHTQECM